MAVLSTWNRYWFSTAPYIDLAIVRILMIFLQLFLILSEFDYYANAVNNPAEIYLPLPMLKVIMLPWGWGARPDEFLVMSVYWVTLAAGILALIGLLTNISLFCFAIGSMFLQAFAYSFGESHHSEAIMMISLLVFAFSPCGKVFSIDAWIRGLRRQSAGSVNILKYDGIFAGWAIRLMQWVFSLIYVSAVLSKLMHGGIDWANGFTLQYYLIEDGLRHGSGLALWISQFHYPVLLAQLVVLFFQSTFFLIILFPRLKWIYLPIGVIIHFGIYLTLTAPFPQWIVLYALFVPWSQAFHWLASHSVKIDKLQGQGI